MKYFIFDIDGVLAESRQRVSENFSNALNELIKRDEIESFIYVSGSSYSSMKYQAPRLDTYKPVRFYPLLANNYVTHVFDPVLIGYLHLLLIRFWVSIYNGYYSDIYSYVSARNMRGYTINNREGTMINFSLIGSEASEETRNRFAELDSMYGIRLAMIDDLKQQFTGFQFLLGGKVSIDIVPGGKGKEQLLNRYNPKDCVFFCDRYLQNGNDHLLAKGIEESGGVVHRIDNGPKQTLEIIKELYL